jgi:hypothetical protein
MKTESNKIKWDRVLAYALILAGCVAFWVAVIAGGAYVIKLVF